MVMVKVVNLSPDGREQVVGLHFRGDWLGFDGIATGHYGCDVIAMDTGEVWSFRYDALLEACAAKPALRFYTPYPRADLFHRAGV